MGTALVLGLGVRLLLLSAWPGLLGFDSFQRWAARDHLLVQGWLPLTQALVWVVGRVSGDPFVLQVVFAALGALAGGALVRLAQVLGGHVAGWVMVGICLFGPWLEWTLHPFQESTFLLLFAGGLVAWDRGRLLLADVLVGALALVRYEGWPLVLVYVALRQELVAGRALWAASLWLVLSALSLTEGVHASPDSFDDWAGLSERFDLERTLELVGRLGNGALGAGALWILMVAPLGVALGRRSRVLGLVLIALLGQLAATLGWVVGLNTFFNRMTLLPTMLGGVLAAVGVAGLWPRLPAWGRVGVGLTGVCFVLWFQADVRRDLEREHRYLRHERPLLADLEACSGDSWSVIPRTPFGVRMRHDSCETIQGYTSWRVGQDFVCVGWTDWGGPEPSLEARWDPAAKEYKVVRLKGEGSPSCPY